MDDSDAKKLCQVETSLLRNCRFGKQIEHDAPERDEATGREFYRLCMTRAMFATFVRCLNHGELTLSKGVTLSEALATFEYEGIGFDMPSAVVSVRDLEKTGMANSKRPIDRLRQTCEQVATAIALWPRLESALEAAFEDRRCSFTCTSTRVWVRFASKPSVLNERGDHILNLARKWPPWLQSILSAVGVLHSELVRSGVVDAKARDADSFALLQNKVESDMLGPFFSTRFDFNRSHTDRDARRVRLRGEKFANEIRSCIMDNVIHTTSSQQPEGVVCVTNVPRSSEAVTYARSWLAFAHEAIMEKMPMLSTLFSGRCADESSKTAERGELSRSLQNRGIRIVKWMDSEDGTVAPLVFPSPWRESHIVTNHFSTVLLDLSNLAS